MNPEYQCEADAENIAKLRARYPDGFSTEKSLARLDEAEGKEGR
jgi:hypothetical protein